jgi:hypothetical protein
MPGPDAKAACQIRARTAAVKARHEGKTSVFARAWSFLRQAARRAVPRKWLSVLAVEGRDFHDHWRWRGSALAALLPHGTYEHRYRYSELTDEPILWPVPAQWRSEIDAWINAAGGGRESVDAMVHMLRSQPLEEQPRLGIVWVERLVTMEPVGASRTFLLPEWLRDVRSNCDPAELAAWQRIVDTLVVHGDHRVRDLSD